MALSPLRFLAALLLVARVHASNFPVFEGATALENREHILRTQMSTKTMYPTPTPAALGEERELLADSSADACAPIQLNYVIRHGTRFPTIKDIDRIAETRAKLLRTSLPERLATWAADWTNPFDTKRAGWLAAAGVFEQISLGKRLRERFAGKFAKPFHADAYVFEHTYKPRTLQSAMGFSFGFFGGVQPVHYASDPIGQDHELRFFDNCPAFDHRVENNKTATEHHTAYRRGAQMKRNLRKFQQLAGDDKKILTQKDLEAAYAGCAFDVAVRATLDEWCALFDEEMLQSMDYFHDLKHFYKKSHGHALAFEIAAPLLQDIHRSMLARVQGSSQVEGHFRFAHAETILPLASLLNLSYFDRHLSDREGHFLADTPLEVATKRPFRGAVLAPFSANIGFVLYRCEGGDSKASYRVQTLLHERTVQFPDCDGQALCPLEKFEDIFGQWIHEYDFFSECAI